MFPPKDRSPSASPTSPIKCRTASSAQDRHRRASRCATREEFDARIGEADVLVVSGMWHNDLIALAPQAALHPVDQRRHRPVFDGRARRKGMRLASAAGVNARAVAEHAMALILAVARRLPEARDNQAQEDLARHDRRPRAARGRARRQDAADHRHGPHRRAPGQLAKAFDMK